MKRADQQPLPGMSTLPGLPLIPVPTSTPAGQYVVDPTTETTPQLIPPTPPKVLLSKLVREYPLPAARQTHEMVLVDKLDMLVISQQTNSTLVKVNLDPTTGRPQSCSTYVVGDNWAGLHGLAASRVYPGHVWGTLQFRSLIVRIDVSLDQVPQVIQLPLPAFGPHCVYEVGPKDLWVSCKDSRHVVRIDHTDPVQPKMSFYPCSSRPIFIAVHGTSNDVYASLDMGSKIWRYNASTGKDGEIDIPPERGSTPVGLITGPDGNIWFTLLGGQSGGTGTFASISKEGKFRWYSLSTPLGTRAGLIHLAFFYSARQSLLDPLYGAHRGSGLRLWLLSSSMATMGAAGASVDAVVTVVLDDKLQDDAIVGRIITEHTIALPSQPCCAHRVIVHRTGLFVSELGISCLAHVSGAAILKPAISAGESIDVTGETTDVYADFGLGQRLSSYTFTEEDIAIPRPPFPPITKPNNKTTRSR